MSATLTSPARCVNFSLLCLSPNQPSEASIDPISSPSISTPVSQPRAEARPAADVAPPTSAPAPRESAQLSAAEPEPTSGAAALSAGLQGSFGEAQGHDIDMVQHTRSRIEHNSRRMNDPATSGAERLQLQREQAQLRQQLGGYEVEQARSAPGRGPLPSERLGQGLDAVRSVTGDRWHVGTAQRVRETWNEPGLSTPERGSRIGGELGGAAGSTVGARAGAVRGAMLGARAGLTGGAAGGAAIGGPVGALAGGAAGFLGGGLIGGAAGWWVGSTVGNGVGQAGGRATGRQVGNGVEAVFGQ